MGTIYLIHFEQPLKHAQHYIGWTRDLDKRVAEHKAGRGSALLAACVAQSISFEVVCTWEGDRYFERALKKRKHASRLCPCCSPKTRVRICKDVE
jgi:predicted GIY-YIG superfamily endonuclease